MDKLFNVGDLDSTDTVKLSPPDQPGHERNLLYLVTVLGVRATGMQGNLQDMAVTDLIQHSCTDRKTARLRVEHDGQQALLFFKAGNVIHAEMGEQQGEQLVYRILGIEDMEHELGLEIHGEDPQSILTELERLLIDEYGLCRQARIKIADHEIDLRYSVTGRSLYCVNCEMPFPPINILTNRR